MKKKSCKNDILLNVVKCCKNVVKMLNVIQMLKNVVKML